ncbi:DUF427 domain-containing protein [Amycolatopsis jiangsuensis]|uniref:Uncharacterized protein (DUF427 family) n=1 Tax=Amycolatopsis jiangsuensis TaxID=1181879 RepID=A0A840IST7_9PSEU|nr:DUF427 domain-containing protein [Amycolatopsis jiangsuensis]MBB4684208.1 uncharacterized protein (DUF427 family) [Amycolatopsis jiangsuensis]
MSGYPAAITGTGHVEPVPRRVRAVLAGETVVDTVRAKYGWEWPYYPQFFIPVADVRDGVLIDEDHRETRPLGPARRHGLRVHDVHKPGAAWVSDTGDGLAGHVRFDWSALDAWFEEDEQIFVHPRSPYTRVDALRSTRRVRVSLDGVVLAESSSPVLLFETGLPTRYYFNRTEVDFSHLVPTAAVTACPYKGRTSAYWSVRAGGTLHEDLAWSYDHPVPAVAAITGLVAFYNEMVDIEIDGEPLPRPHTHFAR